MSNRAIAVALQAIVSVSLIVWLLMKFDLTHTLQVVRAAQVGYVMVGFTCALLLIMVMAERFSTILDKGGMGLSWRQVLMLSWVGQFWNIFLPGSTGGDLYRLGALWSAYPSRKADALWAVFSDRLVATVVLAVIAGMGLFFVPLGGLQEILAGRHLGSVVRYMGWALLLFAAITVAVPVSRRLAQNVIERLTRQVMCARVFLWPDRKLARTCAWSLIGHGLNLTVFFCYARCVGLPISFFQVCVFFPLVMLLLILPISINGHGVREVLLVTFLHSFSIVPAQGGALTETVLALSIVGISSDLLLGLAGGIIYIATQWKRATAVGVGG